MKSIDREGVTQGPNRLGLAGIEFIEYATQRPQALGQVVEALGYRPVARHRSREVVLYRQGGMNLVINANTDEARGASDQAVLSAVAFRVADARLAHERCLALGAWGAVQATSAGVAMALGGILRDSVDALAQAGIPVTIPITTAVPPLASDIDLDLLTVVSVVVNNGATATVNADNSITFTPSAEGLRTASFSLASNDADESPFVINVKGTGHVAPSIATQPASKTGNPHIAVSFSVVAKGSPTMPVQ